MSLKIYSKCNSILQNGFKTGQTLLTTNYSKNLIPYLDYLLKQGLISTYTVTPKKKLITIFFKSKYLSKSIIKNFNMESSRECQRFCTNFFILKKQFYNKKKFYMLSSSKGLFFISPATKKYQKYGGLIFNSYD